MEKIYNTKLNNDAVMDMSAPSEQTGTPHHWMRERSSERKTNASLTPYQLTSLSAMIAYCSYCSGTTEFRIERSLSDHFSVPNPKCLPANDFDNAIRYLAEIIPD